MARKSLTVFASLASVVLSVGFAASMDARGSGRTPAFRIQSRGNATFLSIDEPVRRGSIVLFHRASDGRLTGVPAEDVASVVAVSETTAVTAAATSRTLRTTRIATAPVAGSVVRPLAPGEAVLVGPTGGEGAAATSASTPTAAGSVSPSGEIPARQSVEAQVFPGDLPAQTGQTGQSGTGAMVNGSPVYANTGSTAINPTLQTRPVISTPTGANPATVPTNIGPNGFPATGTTGTPNINPNGFPSTTTTGPQSGTQPINPNGFPALTTPSTSNPRGATVTTAPAGTAGSTAAVAAANAAAAKQADAVNQANANQASTTRQSSTSSATGAKGATTAQPNANSNGTAAPQGASSTQGTSSTPGTGSNGTTGTPQGSAPPSTSSSPH